MGGAMATERERSRQFVSVLEERGVRLCTLREQLVAANMRGVLDQCPFLAS